MPTDLKFWHARYLQQVGWSLEARRYIFRKISLAKSAPILEVGSGTGALLSSLRDDGFTHMVGLDIDLPALHFSAFSPSVCADAHALPFPSGAFSLAICHYLLLWVRDPLTILREMCRFTPPGGWVVALSEPDYTAREDHPAELAPLGRAQTRSLTSQGADVGIGARLGDLFRQVGLRNVETGILTPQRPGIFDEQDFDLEWAILRHDLHGRLSVSELNCLYEFDRQAALHGDRHHYVPTHFAFGQKP